MTLDDVIEQLARMQGNGPASNITDVEAEVDGVFRGRAHCSECNARMDIAGQPVTIKRAELSYIKRDGRRVVFHFAER